MRRPPLLLALAAVLVAASPAHAAPRWSGETLPFGDVPARELDASAVLAPDGRAVFARFAPDGALEVRERPPGGPVGATITLPPVTVEPPARPNLQLLMGADGTAAVLFDAGGARYASMRAPGAYWTDPEPISPAGAGPGQAAIGPDGALWVAAQSPEDATGLAVFRMTAGHAGTRASFPAPRAGARDLFPALVAPTAGSAHVIYVERGATEAGAGCAVRTAVLAVDVPAQGANLPPRRLDAFDATGEGTPDICHLAAGQIIVGSPLLAADAAGADTAVYSVVALESFTVTPLARHREWGATWPTSGTEPPEVVSDTDAIAERIVGGAGAPLVVLRSADGKAITTRGDDHWTPAAPLLGEEDASTFQAARTGAGTTVFAWVVGAFPGRTVGRVANASGVLGAPVTLRETGSVMLAVSGDARGNALALYSRPGGDAFVLGAIDYDVDGEPEPAPYPDSDPVVEAPPEIDTSEPQEPPTIEPSAPPESDERAPRLERVSISPKRVHAGRAATLALATDEAGRTTITLTKTGRCAARACPRRTISRAVRPGTQRVRLPRLSAGAWTLTVVVTDAAGNASRPRHLHLHVAS
ncbi:hypothetical protein OM076_14770 [Solirubrobacter ginsenosidimutans]|uniref:Uncharacterized protein n=1 Tax=Solirubrobacter ginsenosidimutans TaxID=490573 RepID=A0A9X3S1W1_9ACTN|nr:hypothetical protein [Solirubrobacter ginsenosidimutans]MDA0161537.1 hypothetical protein [Solirubrobacter ginsenosidimutans]